MVFESQEIMSYNKDDSLEQYLTTSGGKTYNCFFVLFFFWGGGGGGGKFGPNGPKLGPQLGLLPFCQV